MMKNALFKAIWEQSRGWVFVILTLILLSVVLLVYQTQFVSPEKEQLIQRQSFLQNQLRTREAKQLESDVPVSDVEQMEKDLLRFSEMIPVKQEFSDFVGELFHWAEQTELEIKQISYQLKIDEETEYLHYGLSFSLQGRYQQLKKFIHLLENSKRILIIEKIGLSGKRSKDKSSAVDLQINLTTLFQEGAE